MVRVRGYSLVELGSGHSPHHYCPEKRFLQGLRNRTPLTHRVFKQRAWLWLRAAGMG